MKKLISVFVLIAILCTFVSGFAAPQTLSAEYHGNSRGLIVITNPEYQKSNTLEKNYVISGYGNDGVELGFYKLSGGKYVKFSSSLIGASGLFMKQVALSNGKNSIMVVATDRYGNTQTERLEINLLNQRFLSTLKSVAANLMGL